MPPPALTSQPLIGVDDIFIYLLQRAYSHLDGAGGKVKNTFIDFSIAFNTTQPRLLWEKKRKMHVEAPLVSWVVHCEADHNLCGYRAMCMTM